MIEYARLSPVSIADFDQGLSMFGFLRRIGILLEVLFEDAGEIERGCCLLRRAPLRVPSARLQTELF